MPLGGNRTQLVATVALIASMVIWSASGIAIKQAMVVLQPLTMIILRFTPSVFLMFVIGILCRRSELFRLQRIDVRDLPLFLIAGFCQPFLYYLLETYSYDALNSPTVAEALLSTNPLFSPLFAAVLLRERVTKYNIIGILVSTVGMFMLILAGSTDFQIGNYWGIPLAFAAVSAAIVDSVMMRKIPARYTPLSIIFYAQVISLLFFYPVWFWREGPSALAAIDWTQLADISSPLSVAVISVRYLTIFSSVIAFILFCYALRIVGVTQANAFNNIRPAFTALWMFLFFGEHLPAAKWVGMLLVIIGLFVCQRKPSVQGKHT
ncbi:MAG: EamA family transporter [Paludibacteraceae bacterium]|nr:EamA family transporter [Paludibacteraceae bacterium]